MVLLAFVELRKDWARQKKTIEQLVRAGGEDRQVLLVVCIGITDPAGKLGKDAHVVQKYVVTKSR